MNRHQIKSRTKKFCQITKMHLDSTEVIHVQLIKESIVENLKQDFPEMDSSGFVSVLALNRYYFKKIKPAVADAGHADPHDISSISIESEMIYTETEDFGNRLADRIAAFGGSWKFIIIFGLIIFIWIIINTILGAFFDPYPFILLNLVLSTLAALQAPVIMMSQNRLEIKDRERADNDYDINIKAELEVRELQGKLDYVIAQLAEMKPDLRSN